jgi:hypothetical protein
MMGVVEPRRVMRSGNIVPSPTAASQPVPPPPRRPPPMPPCIDGNAAIPCARQASKLSVSTFTV